LGKILESAHMLFFSRKERQEEDYRLRVKQSALYPA